MLISNKLKHIRTMLNMSQDEFARETGMYQNDISRLETGRKKFFTNQLISFLVRKNINLNDLFDENVTVDEFRTGRRKDSTIPCNECKAKDAVISSMTETIAAQRVTVDTLRLRIEEMKAKTKQEGKKAAG